VNPPAYGPPIDPVKPSAEFYGEVLLAVGDFQGAVTAFENNFFVFPNRTLTLIGLARSHVGIGNLSKSCQYYSTFLYQWRKADLEQPLYNEAHQFQKEHC